MQDLHYLTALSVGQQIRQGEMTSVEITETILRRIETFSNLSPYVTVCADVAVEQAKQADAEASQGKYRSLLHGVPIAVKDLLATAGIKTTNGMSIYADQVPDHDATVVSRLRDAGTVLLGKLKLTEGAFARHHPDVEIPLNPWNEELWTGVSSSGSGVATSAGLCYVSLGSDTGGSIRFPSAACGVVGLKPTWGRVSRHGAFPLAYSLDHIGPMTRSISDAATVLQIIAGADPDDPTSSSLSVPDYLADRLTDLSSLRIGIDDAYNSEGADPIHLSALDSVKKLLTDQGCGIVSVTIPYSEVTGHWALTTAVEAAHAHRDTYPDRKEEYGAIGSLLEQGLAVDAAAYMLAEMARKAFKAQLAGIFETCDVLLCPSMPFYALPHEASAEFQEAETNLTDTLKFTAPYNYAGSPTLSIPWQVESRQPPASIQLVGRPFEEKLLIDIGTLIESERGELPHPPVTGH